MKKFVSSLFLSLLVMCGFAFTGCSKSTQNLAKELSTSVSNFVNSVSSLDWPSYEQLDAFDSIAINNAGNKSNLEAADKSNDSSNAADDSGVKVDTSIDTSEIYTWIEILRSNINILNSKRADLLLYIDEMYANNVKLSEADTLAIKVYMNIIKDNSTYLSNYKGMLKNQLNEATSLYHQNKNTNLINAYLIKAVETLQSRSAKIDTGVLAMNSIIDILDSNLINKKNNDNVYSINPNTKVQEDKTPKEDNAEPKQEVPTPTEQKEPADEPSTNSPEQTMPEQNNIAQQPGEQEQQTEPENAINFASQPKQVDSTPIGDNNNEQQVSTNDNKDAQVNTLNKPTEDGKETPEDKQ